MSNDDDHVTANESPIAKHVADLVSLELKGRLEAMEAHVIAGVINGLGQWRAEVDGERSSTRIKLEALAAGLQRLETRAQEQAREIENLNAIVRGPDFAAFIEHHRSETERPPDTERPR